MSYLNHLKRTHLCDTCRWIIKREPNGPIREVKLLFNPEEYKKLNRHNRKLYNKQELIIELENYKK